MKEQMLDLLSKNATTLSTTDILINFSVALAIGMLIFISYRTAHTRVVYSARFNVTLLMLTMVTTLVMHHHQRMEQKIHGAMRLSVMSIMTQRVPIVQR